MLFVSFGLGADLPSYAASSFLLTKGIRGYAAVYNGIHGDIVVYKGIQRVYVGI